MRPTENPTDPTISEVAMTIDNLFGSISATAIIIEIRRVSVGICFAVN